MPEPMPKISPSPDGSRFWEAASEHRVELPRCGPCGHAFFYPRSVCPRCGSRDIEWVRASGRGTLYSFCVHYHSSLPGLAEAVPFVTALVDLEEGPRIMAFLEAAASDPDLIECGSPVEAGFLDLPDGQAVLKFRFV